MSPPGGTKWGLQRGWGSCLLESGGHGALGGTRHMEQGGFATPAPLGVRGEGVCWESLPGGGPSETPGSWGRLLRS